MERRVTVKLGLTDLSASALLERGRNHVEMLTGNASFPTPTPALATITTACNDLETSITAVLFHGGRVAHEQKRTRERALYGLLKELAGYVQANCDNDRDKVLSAGFEFRADSRPVEKLEMPQALRAQLTDFSGQVPLRWKKVPNAVNYQVFSSTDPNEPKSWELVAFTSRTSYTVEALQSATFYWFRVQALGRKGLQSPVSDPVRALAA